MQRTPLSNQQRTKQQEQQQQEHQQTLSPQLQLRILIEIKVSSTSHRPPQKQRNQCPPGLPITHPPRKENILPLRNPNQRRTIGPRSQTLRREDAFRIESRRESSVRHPPTSHQILSNSVNRRQSQRNQRKSRTRRNQPSTCRTLLQYARSTGHGTRRRSVRSPLGIFVLETCCFEGEGERGGIQTWFENTRG